MGGHKADTDAMASASKKMTEFAEDVTEATKDLKTSKVDGKGFGNEHGGHASMYTTAVGTLSAAVTGYCTALTGFAGNVAAGGQAYADNEQSQTGAIDKAGSM